ncbi:MAG: SPFH domain-containing protein [Oligoflexales bacterium]
MLDNSNDVFEKKDEIAISVKKELSHTMSQFGWGIVMTLVTDIEPDANVKHAMNEITAAQRLRIAATEKGEADRIIRVKAAEAEAQSKALQGRGIADQRKAIVDGLRESIDDFQKSIPESSADSVMNLVLVTQYFDALKDIAANNKSSTVLVPHSPSVVTDLQQQIRDILISSQTVTNNIQR